MRVLLWISFTNLLWVDFGIKVSMLQSGLVIWALSIFVGEHWAAIRLCIQRWKISISKLKVQELLFSHSFSITNQENLTQKLPYSTVLNGLWNNNFLRNLLKKFFFCVNLMRSLTNQHLIEYYSNGKEIRFIGIVTFFEWFRRHIEWSTNIHLIFKSESRFGWKPEIRYFPFIAHP